MKPIFCLPLFLASFAWADEAADRADIARVIAMLNDSPPPLASVAESPEAAAEMAGRARTARLYKPVLFVMKKVGGHWKIASARMLAPS